MSIQDSNLKVGNQTKEQVREQQEHQRGGEREQGQAYAPDEFHHQTDRERKQPEINRSQQGVDKARGAGPER